MFCGYCLQGCSQAEICGLFDIVPPYFENENDSLKAWWSNIENLLEDSKKERESELAENANTC